MNLNNEKIANEFEEFVNTGKRSASDFEKLAYISAEKITLYMDLAEGVDKVLSSYNELKKMQERDKQRKLMVESIKAKW